MNERSAPAGVIHPGVILIPTPVSPSVIYTLVCLRTFHFSP